MIGSHRGVVGFVVAAALAIPVLAGQGKSESLTRAALEQRLAEEKARLARLKAQLDRIKRGESVGEEPTKAKPRATKPSSGQKPSADQKGVEAKNPLEQHPQLGAADALYRLGRYAEARKVYRAVAAAKETSVFDRIWALLQAGNCSRRLGEFDDAIETYQAILADYKDKPWFKAQVEWALRAAQWEKRWHRATTAAGE